jgi:hypothetical protein
VNGDSWYSVTRSGPVSNIKAVRWILRLAFVGASYSAGVLGWLFLPGDRPVPDPIWVAAFLGLFPVYGAAVVYASRRWRRPSAVAADPPAVKRTDRTVIGVVSVLVALGVVVLILTAAGSFGDVPPGDPGIQDGQYVLNNHGEVTPISHEEYLEYSEASQRGFVGIALLFYLVAGVITAIAATRPGSGHRPRRGRTAPRSAT